MGHEAIWLSIQENGRQKSPVYVDAAASENYNVEGHYAAQEMAPLTGGSSSSPSGGLACAIAALAERQQMGGESFVHNNNGNVSASNMLPGSSTFYSRLDQDAENYPPRQSCSNTSSDCRMVMLRGEGDWAADRGSDAAEAGTSYASSGTTEEAGGISASLPPPPPPSDEMGSKFQNNTGPIVPESFEEQMMLAMAVSLADAQAVTGGTGNAWQ
ncbi:E3 ubiquitin-protein ligase DA2 [Jatropha curcas]|uniref:E3 ubiquitin-protein ligase DA2 n=1 Tax=Jatropha curcas TaxID=180498 RepID=UPI001895F67E|nr:E3 ubiquitin-protein ligase DA2 [Jatropha curcas]